MINLVLNISPKQAGMLYVIWRFEPLTLSEICKHLKYSPQNVIHDLKFFEEEKLIRKEMNLRKRNEIKILITSRGITTLDPLKILVTKADKKIEAIDRKIEKIDEMLDGKRRSS